MRQAAVAINSGSAGGGMRVVVIGTSGAGKSTMAAAISARFGVPVVEMDALNWQPGWRPLAVEDPAAFLAAVDAATAGDGWVVAGNYSATRHVVWARATHLVWLDYPKRVVMRRVLLRSLRRVLWREVLWGGNREGFRAWLDPGHPVRWAWTTWQPNRSNTAQRLAEPLAAHLIVVQVRNPRDTPHVLARLAREDD